MENRKSIYDQENSNHKNALSTDDFEKSKLKDDSNQDSKISNNLNINDEPKIISNYTEDENWKKEDVAQKENSSSVPTYDPDENFEEVSDMDDAKLEPDLDDVDLDDEDESDSEDESDIDKR